MHSWYATATLHSCMIITVTLLLFHCDFIHSHHHTNNNIFCFRVIVTTCTHLASASCTCGNRVTQTSGPSSCSSFDSGQYSVAFTASDCSGNTATCVMSFTVASQYIYELSTFTGELYICSRWSSVIVHLIVLYIVTTCPYMDYPINAQSIIYSSLYQQPVYGDTAEITCKAGYTISGPSTQTCSSDGSWNAGGSSAVTCNGKWVNLVSCTGTLLNVVCYTRTWTRKRE